MNRRSTIKDRQPIISPAMAGMAMLLVTAATAAGDVAALRSSAEASGASVTLRDVAELEGDYAEELGDVEVAAFDAGQSERSVTLREVRERVTEQGVHWGRLTLRGASSITLRRVVQPRAAKTGDAEPITAEKASAEANPVPEVAIDPSGGPAQVTLRRRIAEWVREQIGVERSNIKITFEDDDDTALERSTFSARFEFEPISRDTLGRVPIVVRRYENDRLVSTDRVRIDVRVRRPVVVARRSLRRGRTITERDVKLENVWLDSPNERPLADLSQAIGLRATGLVRADGVLGEDDVRSPILVERGQLITVRCISGGLVLKTVGRAMEDGENGRLITVRNERTRETFHARVSGPQEAVLTVDQPGQLAATPNATQEAKR